METEDELSSSDEESKKDSSSKVAYRPLDLDSDVESDLSSVGPRSRRRVLSKDYDLVFGSDQASGKNSQPRREFPNPDNYEDPRLNRKMRYEDQNGFIDGSSRTGSFEFAKKRQGNETPKKGDFNEVGIPIVDPPALGSPRLETPFMKDVKSLINQYELNAEQADDQESVRSGERGKVVTGVPLIAMAKRPSSSGGQPEDRPQSRESNSPKNSSKGSRGTLHTDF